MAGRWGEAVPLFREAAEASRQVGDEVGAATTAQNLGEMLVKQNRFDEAEGVLRDAVRVFQASGNQTGANPEVLLAQVLMHRGAFDDAHELLSKDIAAFRSTDQPLLALETAAVLTDCLLRMGEPQEGLNLLAQAAAEAGDDAEYVRPVTAISRARALLALEDYDAAEAEIAAGLAAAIENQLPYEEAMLRSVRMELAERAGRAPEPEDSGAVRAIFDQLEIHSLT
jgi:tetratricopeptide (TPR) repeat protein